MSNKRNAIILGFVFLLFTVAAIAQPKENDPYTIIGIGNINDMNFANVAAMPGLSATYHDPFFINVQNPASYGHLQLATFTGGGYYQFKSVKTNAQTAGINTGNLSYFSLGLPFINSLNRLSHRKQKPYQYGMTFNLVPFTRTGYNMEVSTDIPEIGEVRSTFEGDGGTYKFLWGNAFRYKNISVGLNMGYVFGRTSSEHWDYFSDFFDEYRNRYITETSVNGFVWNAGVMYEYVLPKDEEALKEDKRRTRITFGAFGNSKSSVNTKTDYLYERRQALNGLVTDVDTIVQTLDGAGTIDLPAEVGFGVMIAKDQTWKVGVDYTFTGWSGYANSNNNTTLTDAFRLALGAEFVPDYKSYNKYYKRMRYRFGAFYKTDPRSGNEALNGDDFNHYGFTFGTGLPLKLQKRTLPSFLDLGVEVGRYGAPDIINETYIKMTVGFTLNDDLWFFQRKYD